MRGLGLQDSELKIAVSRPPRQKNVDLSFRPCLLQGEKGENKLFPLTPPERSDTQARKIWALQLQSRASFWLEALLLSGFQKEYLGPLEKS